MNDCLFIAPGAERLADSRLYWQPAQGAGRWLQADTLGELADLPLTLVLPGEWLATTRVALPTQKARWLRQALQYAVEDAFAEDVEQLHLATGAADADGQVRVLAIRRDRLRNLLDEAQALGLAVRRLVADFDLLPGPGPQAVLLGERGLLGGDGEARLVFPAGEWPRLADHLPQAELHQPHDAHAWLARQQAQAIDLAQGEFAIRPPRSHNALWRPVAGLLALGLGLQLLFDLGQAWYLQRQGDAYAAQSRALYQQLFPEDSRIVNLRAQFDEHLNQASGPRDSGFLGLLQQVGANLEPGLTLEQVDYSAERGDLALQVRAGNFGQLELLRQRLTEAGLNAQLGSASRDEQGVSARVMIGGGA